MYNPIVVTIAVFLYIAVLFFIALLVERGPPKIKQIASSPYVYSLALAVYCTSWTYYGSVGSAANAGMLFLSIYLGPTMAIGLWWFIMRKLIRIKSSQRITSIADLVSARYGKSQALAAIATALALIGTTPYIALQLKAVTSSFTLITVSGSNAWIENNIGPAVVALMILFTIIFGVRRLDPTERHEGVIAALAVECLVKLVAFLAVGIFVTYFLYGGMGDIFQQLETSDFKDMLNVPGQGATSYLNWMTYLVLAMSAIMFLPRQFHVTVVENPNENHLKTAIWLFPLYLFLINIFVVPIAAGGLLHGLPASKADTFVLALPLQAGQSILALAVFIGGFSAATGMIIVSSMTTATMVTNHLMLPLVGLAPWLNFLQRHLLRARWVAVTLIIAMGYGFEQLTGDSYTLVNMGLISFAAVLQFAPVILGGIFWRQGNKIGAVLGLSAGFFVWFYTLLLPSFVRSGWISSALLEEGPFGITLLAPEQFLGITGLSPLTHTVLWSLLFNIGLYVLGSFYFDRDSEEERMTDIFIDALSSDVSIRSFAAKESNINLSTKTDILETLLNRYFSPLETMAVISRELSKTGIKDKKLVSVAELAEFYGEVEKSLAGSIGAATAYRTLNQAELFTEDEAKELAETYNEILANLRVSPEDLRRRIDYYQERDALLTGQAAELEVKVTERTRALEASASISRQLTTFLNLDELLRQVVHLIQRTFDYYHVQIYLLNEDTHKLVFHEGTGEIGRKLKAIGHTLRLGQGVIGQVAQSQKPFLARDINQIPDFVNHPLLSHTRAELAVPLHKGDTVLGVLDMQRRRVGSFSHEDLLLIQSIADQLSTAVDNAHLFQRMEAAVAEIEALNRRLTRETWANVSDKLNATGYTYTESEARPEVNDIIPAVVQAVQQKNLVQHIDNHNNQMISSVAIPLVLRDEIIGIIGIDREGDRQWTGDELAAIQAVTEQVALALDTARLARETEQRAAREEIIANLTRSVWTGDDIESVLRNSVTQLGQTLKASKVVLHLNPENKGEEVKQYTAPNLLQSWMSGGAVGWKKPSSDADSAKKR